MSDAWFQAIENGEVESVLDMLRHGENINALDGEGGSTALMLAAKYGYFQLLAALLDHGASMEPINCIDYSALTYAAIISRAWDVDVWGIHRPDPRRRAHPRLPDRPLHEIAKHVQYPRRPTWFHPMSGVAGFGIFLERRRA